MSLSEMQQGTADWLKWRETRIGASESAAVLGVSPWSTRYELWCIKTGRGLAKKSKGGTNFAIDRGNRFEPAIRSLLELETGLEFPPEICEHPTHKYVVASLDGRNRENRIIAEFKAPGKEVFDAAKIGILSEEDEAIIKSKGWRLKEHCTGGLCVPKYYVQCQQQLMVTGDEKVLYYCGKVEGKNHDARVTDTARVDVFPDIEFQKYLLFDLISFWDFVQKDIAPPITDDDVVCPDDQSTVFLFERLKKLKKMITRAKTEGEDIRLLDEKYRDVRLEAIDHVENEIRHPRVSSIGVNMYKNKKGGWIVTVD